VQTKVRPYRKQQGRQKFILVLVLLIVSCSGKVGFSGVALLDNTNQAQHDARGAGSGENDEHSKL
jgi:hypothetical protein